MIFDKTIKPPLRTKTQAAEMTRKDFLRNAGVAGAALTAAALGGLTTVNAMPSTRERQSNVTGVGSGWSPNDPLLPTGDSTTDTDNLQAAIHDPSMDAGGTLYLGAGTFLVHASLVRQGFFPPAFGYNPVPFNGTIKGADKGETIVRSVRGPLGEDFTPFHEPFLNLLFPVTFWITEQDYVGVKDMTFEADPEITAFNFYGTNALYSYVETGSGIFGFGNQSGADVINVGFKGTLDSSGTPDMPRLFEVFGGNGGTYNFKSCQFENGRTAMLNCGQLRNAAINIGGSPREKVTFTNALGAAARGGVCGDCTANVSHIETHEAPGFAYNTHPSNTQSSVDVSHSRINQRRDSNWAGVEIWGTAGETSAVISHNALHGEDSFPFGPIFAEGVRHGVIANNRITGSGSAAIYLGVYQWLLGQWSLVGNNVQKWVNTGLNPWFITAAAIWLGPNVIDSIVVGGNNKMNIFDEPGYDANGNPAPPDSNGNAQRFDENGNIVPKNNVFTGVNNMHLNIGQDVRDAMRLKVEARQALMEQGAALRSRGGKP